MLKRLSTVSIPSRPGTSLNDIAVALGVSATTVSNALLRKGRVSPETAERIRDRAAALGYMPSPAARALRTGRTNVLGLVLPDIANPLFPQIAQAIEAAAARAGYGVLIADSRGGISTQTEAVERLLSRGVDGMVVVPRRGTRMSDVGCPLAVIDTPSTPGNTVAADHWGGGRLIGAHLAALGHQKVLIVGANPASNVQNDRVGGIKAGLGPEVTSQILWIEKLEEERGQGCSLSLAEHFAAGATAFAAISDLHALRALTELQRAGIGVPEDASVTGFDDLIWSSVVTPTLTTVHMDMERIAEIAVATLVQAVESNGVRASSDPSASVVAEDASVPMELFVRQSSGPAASGRRHLKQGAQTQ